MFGDSIRNRRSSNKTKGSMKSFGIVVSDAASTIKRLPVKAKCFLIFTLFLSLYIYGTLLYHFTRNHLAEDNYLQTDKCPACYGHTFCFALKDKQIKMKGWSKIRMLDFVNVKNVHFGEHVHLGHTVVLKKLAHDKELDEFDERICKDANREKGCDVARVLPITNTGDEIRRLGLLPKHLKGSAYMFTCPTYRLIDKVMESYKEKMKPKVDEAFFIDKLQLYATAMVNPEPLVLQTFPASEGWPFPDYYGACGRFIAESYNGEPLYNFYTTDWPKRADLAYQIMKIADRLTNNGGDFALYWTDLSYENLVVDGSGKVTVVDTENIIVVDRAAVKRLKPPGWDLLHESKFDDCGGKNCLIFSTEDLCSRVDSDHNYYAACRNLLSKYGHDEEQGLMKGLLHDMPAYAVDDWDLENLLNECVHPSHAEGRLKAKTKIIEALENLRNTKEEDMNHDKGKRIT